MRRKVNIYPNGTAASQGQGFLQLDLDTVRRSLKVKNTIDDMVMEWKDE